MVCAILFSAAGWWRLRTGWSVLCLGRPMPNSGIPQAEMMMLIVKMILLLLVNENLNKDFENLNIDFVFMLIKVKLEHINGNNILYWSTKSFD